MYLYGVYSRIAGKIVYVGITKRTIRRRWQAHCRCALVDQSKTRLHRAIREYGADNFQLLRLARADDIGELKRLEVETIRAMGTFWRDGGYNLTYGGDGTHGHKQPQWAIEKRRELSRNQKYALGYHHTDEAKTRIGETSKGRQAALGYRHTAEAKAAIGAGTLRNKPWEHITDESIAKMRASLTGRALSPEHRAAVSAALKGKPKAEEHNRKVGDALRGKPKSEAHRAALKAAWVLRRARKEPR